MLKETTGIQQNSSTNFYITGGTLRSDAACYVHRQADQSLFDNLKQGQFCYVLTSRQMGKSSLMVRTAARLREAGIGVAVLDLTAIGQNLTAEQWYDGLLSRIGRQLQLEDELEDFWFNHPRLGPLQRWMSAIDEVVLSRYPGRLVIFIDEIDTVRSLPFSTDEFFAGIREFYNRRTSETELERLTFCLLGVASPSDLIRDTRMTPFNIGQRIELRDFTEEEAASLVRGMGRDDQAAAELLNRVLYWTGGHPYLTQRLCRVIAEDQSAIGVMGVDEKCAGLFFARRAQEGDDNLLFVRERMLHSEVDLAGLLTLYEQMHRGRRVQDDETNQLISHLKLAGIVGVDAGQLQVRNRIYKQVFDPEWIREHMPDAELRRQRAAYRRGMIRTTTIATVIVAALTTLAIIAYQQRNLAQAREEEKRQQLYAVQMNDAMRAWENARIPRMLDDLNNHIPKPGQKDLRGFEWFYLWGLANSALRSFPNQEVATPVSFYPESSVVFLPDNTRLATSGSDSVIRVWDVISGKLTQALQSNSGAIWTLAISPDGRYLASAGESQDVKIWDTSSWLEVNTLKGHKALVHAIAFSPESNKLATASDDNSVKVWNIKTGSELMSLAHPSIVTSVAFSPDGKSVATGGQDSGTYESKIRFWNSETGKELMVIKAHSRQIFTLDFSPNGKLLMSGGGDFNIKLWDVATGRIVTKPDPTLASGSRPMSLVIPGAVLSVKFSPDGSQVAVAGSDRVVRLYSASALSLLSTIKGHGFAVDSVAFSSDGKYLASSGKDGKTKVWDINVRQEKSLFLTGSEGGSTYSMKFTPDNRFLIATNYPHGVDLWDVIAGVKIRSFEGHTGGVAEVVCSSDGKKLVTGSDDHTAKIWDMASGKELLTLRGHKNIVWGLSISPDNRLLATGSWDQTVRLWDFLSGTELYVFQGHTGEVSALAFSPDGSTLASASFDKTVKIWDVKTRKGVTSLPHSGRVGRIVYSPDGRILAAATGDGQVRLWDVHSWKNVRTLKGHAGGIDDMAFFPDSSRLVTGAQDNAVIIWDVATGQELLTRKHPMLVTSVAVSPNGKIVASASLNEIKLWPILNPAQDAKIVPKD